MVNESAWDTNASPKSAVNFMEGQDFSVFGVIVGQDDLVIIDEHRVQEDFDEPLLTVNVGVVHVCELVQEEPEMYPDVKRWKEAQIRVYKSPQDG